MSKIYVFAIGGTGSRVLRSLTMLLAAGVECAADTIIPIIIDPDSSGGNVSQTEVLMKNYGRIREKIKSSFAENENKFFRTEIRNIMNNFHLNLQNTEDCRFDQYINLANMSRSDQAMARMLFSNKNLNADMKVGFKGNPHIGSVVLNQFEKSDDFREFANEFQPGDKIFIISSIFGGTGASGFPLLVKILRTTTTLANHAVVNESHIGAITVLPYFNVKQDETSQIDSGTFISKTKSALAYYNRTMEGEGACAVDNMYYISDTLPTTYDNNEGGVEQKNWAHFVELASALAIIDFANQNKSNETIYKEFAIENDVPTITFGALGLQTRNLLQKPLVQFYLMSKFLFECDDYVRQPWAKDRHLDTTFFTGSFMSMLRENIIKEFYQWLKELREQARSFSPFYLDNKDPNRVFDIINGYVLEKKLFQAKNFTYFNNCLNSIDFKRISADISGGEEQNFFDLFYKATQRISKEKFNIQ